MTDCDKLHWLELEAASVRMTLDVVERGEFILLGDGPDDTCLFTGPYKTDDPFTVRTDQGEIPTH